MATPISKQIVDLFYLGGLIDNDGPQYVTAGGQAFVLPPQGESLRLELYKAEDLIRRYNTKGHSVFSLTKIPSTYASAPERKYTRDELLMMLSNLAAEPEEKTEVNFAGEPDAHRAETPVENPLSVKSPNDEEDKEDKYAERNSDSTIAGKSKGKTAKAAAKLTAEDK